MKDKVSVDELRDLIQAGAEVQIVDVRAPGEFRSGHIPGATSVPMDEIESRLADLSAHAPVVLVCHSGQRAEMCRSLVESRRANASYLAGGTSAWIEAGLPVVSSSKARWSLERQVRLGAGSLVLAGVILGAFVDPLWLLVSGFVGAGLTFAGLTDICGMALVLAKLPWNGPARGSARSIVEPRGTV